MTEVNSMYRAQTRSDDLKARSKSSKASPTIRP